MGYMGLDHPNESDNASDLFCEVIESIIKTLNNGLKEPGNCYNTNGVINVALIIEQLIPLLKTSYNDKVFKFLDKVSKLLAKEIKDLKKWEPEDEKSACWHREKYTRMKKNIDKLINDFYG